MPVYPIVARPVTMGLSLDAFARRAGLHPQLVERFVALGLLDTFRDDSGRLWFPPQALRTVARVQRLHTDLALNYAAVGLVLDLLDRIDQLSAQQRRAGGSFPADVKE